MINFPSKEKYDARDLCTIVELLRGEGGCPWDRVQTHETLRRNLLEECDELCEAIDRADPAMMLEELGDVWLQVIFHASIERQAGRFDLSDVADAECRKLISRHPHVFGDVQVSGTEQELQAWEELKRREKHQKTASDAMDGVCRTLPGLWRAEKIQKKGEISPSAEEIAEALGADARALAEAFASPEKGKDALGELLFTAVCAARRLGLDPEEALHARCEQEIRSFRKREAENQ